MEQPGRSSDVGKPPPAGVGRSVERYRPSIEGYLSDVCGPEAAARLTKHVLADLAQAPGPGGSVNADPVASVRRTARRAGVGWLEREARRLPRRLTGRRCQIVPGLLLERSESRISAEDLDRLSKHVDSCPRCSALAGRYAAAERALVAELKAKPRVIRPNRPTAGKAGSKVGDPSRATSEETVARRAPSDDELVDGEIETAASGKHAASKADRKSAKRARKPSRQAGRRDDLDVRPAGDAADVGSPASVRPPAVKGEPTPPAAAADTTDSESTGVAPSLTAPPPDHDVAGAEADDVPAATPAEAVVLAEKDDVARAVNEDRVAQEAVQAQAEADQVAGEAEQVAAEEAAAAQAEHERRQAEEAAAARTELNHIAAEAAAQAEQERLEAEEAAAAQAEQEHIAAEEAAALAEQEHIAAAEAAAAQAELERREVEEAALTERERVAAEEAQAERERIAAEEAIQAAQARLAAEEAAAQAEQAARLARQADAARAALAAELAAAAQVAAAAQAAELADAAARARAAQAADLARIAAAAADALAAELAATAARARAARADDLARIARLADAARAAELAHAAASARLATQMSLAHPADGGITAPRQPPSDDAAPPQQLPRVD